MDKTVCILSVLHVPIPVHCTVQEGHGKDDCCDRTLVIYIELFTALHCAALHCTVA